MATKIKLGTLMRSVSSVIQPVLTNQFGNRPDVLAAIATEQRRSIAFIAGRQKEVSALMTKYKIK
jgi:hypothetical protein